MCDICPLNGISSAERRRVTAKGRRTDRGGRGKRQNRKGVNDSKEGEGDRTGRAAPAAHCFTCHCTEEENLSYASASTIYVPARIMELDGSVEKTPINLIMFYDCLSLSFFLSPSTPL